MGANHSKDMRDFEKKKQITEPLERDERIWIKETKYSIAPRELENNEEINENIYIFLEKIANEFSQLREFEQK